jgi:hypothetical protein
MVEDESKLPIYAKAMTAVLRITRFLGSNRVRPLPLT